MIRSFAFVLALGLGLCIGANAGAQTDYVLDASEESVSAGSSAAVSFSVTNLLGLTGWGWGICESDPSIADIDSVDQGSDVAALNDGDGPDFYAPSILAGQGWTLGAIVELVGGGVLDPGAGLQMNIGNYNTFSGVFGVCTLSYCSTLGSPTVPITLTLEGGGVSDETSGDLTLNTGSVEATMGPPAYTYTGPSGGTTYDPTDGSSANVIANMGISDNQDTPLETQGFSVGFGITGPCFLAAADPTGILASINDGDGPDFFGSNLNPVNGPGFTVGVVYELLGGVLIAYTGPADCSGGLVDDVIAFEFDPIDADLIGDLDGAQCNIEFGETFGDPVVMNTVVVAGASQTLTLCDGVIDLMAFVPPPVPIFIRGDCNDDGIVNIADGINIINVYLTGSTPPIGDCIEACDANNDDAGPDISDAMYVFLYRFLDGPEPPAPFPGCGEGLDTDDCNFYGNCP